MLGKWFQVKTFEHAAERVEQEDVFCPGRALSPDDGVHQNHSKLNERQFWILFPFRFGCFIFYSCNLLWKISTTWNRKINVYAVHLQSALRGDRTGWRGPAPLLHPTPPSTPPPGTQCRVVWSLRIIGLIPLTVESRRWSALAVRHRAVEIWL